MAGRGRGKPTMSFTTEQLGFSKSEVPAPVLQPPQSYPLLERRPLPIIESNEISYLVELKRDFAEYMRESPNNVLPIVPKKDIERYSDRYQDAVAEYKSKYDCSRMPAELRLSRKRKRTQEVQGQKKRRTAADVETKLAELEKKERMTQNGTEEVREEEEEEGDNEEMDELNEDEEEKADREMDYGTDYMNMPSNDENDDSDGKEEGPTF